MKIKLLLALSFISSSITAQSTEMTTALYDTYDSFKEVSLEKRRIKRSDIQPLIEKFKANPKFKVATVGQSIGGRDLSLISLGSGETSVFLWSQMHGDEPTATQAIFDILNFFDSPQFKNEKEAILENLSIHFLPMLNPDGAELFQRRNLLGVDINRDALRLQSPESITLKRIRDSLDADFGFNLHDQSTYYNAERTGKPATISYLAPAYNYEKDINETRANAMKIIVFMNEILQMYAPGQVGRYNDDFEPRAFGDNIQKWGTSTILIESGGYLDDPEKQEIRKLNYVSILSAIYTIANQNYKEIAITEYEKIPENDRKLFDLKIVGVNYELMGNDYILDLGINQVEVDYPDHTSFWYSSRILDQGDLSTFYGYETLDASEYTIKQAKAYPKILSNLNEVEALDFKSLLQKGYGFVRVSTYPGKKINSPFPIHLISQDFKVPELFLRPGMNPTFFLEKDAKIKYAVINGFLVDLEKENIDVPNGMLYK